MPSDIHANAQEPSHDEAVAIEMWFRRLVREIDHRSCRASGKGTVINSANDWFDKPSFKANDSWAL